MFGRLPPLGRGCFFLRLESLQEPHLRFVLSAASLEHTLKRTATARFLHEVLGGFLRRPRHSLYCTPRLSSVVVLCLNRAILLQVGDTVILVDCQQKSKRKKHTLLTIVRKMPRLDL